MTDSVVFVVQPDARVSTTIRSALSPLGVQVREYLSGADFLNEFGPDLHGCLLLDLSNAGAAADLLERLAGTGSQLQPVGLADDAQTAALLRCMRAGLHHIVTKPVELDPLRNRVAAALAEDKHVVKREALRAETVLRLQRLTPREREVLDLIISGKHTRAIAEALRLSPKTVESYRASLMVKMGAENVADLVRKVVASGDYHES